MGDDADNIRVDLSGEQVLVGYGNGGLAVIEPVTRTKAADIKLNAHPESFQIDRASNRIFVNEPTNQSIVVVDRASGKAVATWPTGNGTNFAMTLNDVAKHVLVAFRNPARLSGFSMQDGAPVADVELCGDADDMFVDAKRRRVYVSCGDGHVDVFDARQGNYSRIAHIPTAPGARTSLYVPERDLLLVAVPASSSNPAAMWVFRPQ